VRLVDQPVDRFVCYECCAGCGAPVFPISGSGKTIPCRNCGAVTTGQWGAPTIDTRMVNPVARQAADGSLTVSRLDRAIAHYLPGSWSLARADAERDTFHYVAGEEDLYVRQASGDVEHFRCFVGCRDCRELLELDPRDAEPTSPTDWPEARPGCGASEWNKSEHIDYAPSHRWNPTVTMAEDGSLVVTCPGFVLRVYDPGSWASWRSTQGSRTSSSFQATNAQRSVELHGPWRNAARFRWSRKGDRLVENERHK